MERVKGDRMMRSAILLIIFYFFNVIEIYGLSQREWKGTIEYENGVKVIKNPRDPLYGEIVFDLEEDLIIGDPDDENATFYGSVLVAVDSEDNILVLDRENCRVQKFDEEGNFLQTIGRKGQGPGEFVRPLELILDHDDNIYVSENRKLHKFSMAGEYEKGILLGSFYRSIGITNENFIFAMTQTSTPKDASDNICLLSPDGKIIQTIVSYPKPKPDYSSQVRISDGSVEHRMILCPLDAFSAAYAHSSSYRLFIINSSGEEILIIEKEEQPIPITQKEKKQKIDAMFERLNRGGQQISRREVENVYNFPEMKPFFNSIQTDDENNLYILIVKSYAVKDDNFPYYDFFDKEGYYLFRVKSWPFPIIIKDGCLYCDSRDENGYIYVKRYKIKNWDHMEKAVK